MKFSLYAAALLAFSASAISLESNTEFDKVADFAETEGELEHGHTVKVNIPDCQAKPDPDALIMEAVGDLNSKSNDMAKALKLAFARSARLAATRTMEVKGCISLTPTINEPAAAAAPSTVNIVGGNGCGSGTQLQIAGPACK